MSWLKSPYIKGKGYCVNPVVVRGIPKEADSRNYPNVIGTPAWEQWWEEQLYYIKNGYQTGGLWIPGRYYYYMNYIVMNTIERGAINPDNTDLHLEIAYFIEHCKVNGKHGMMPKGRRRGVSEAFHPMGIDHGYRFSADKWQGAVVAGHSAPINDFMTKWAYAQSQLPPELFVGTLTRNDKEIIAGWQQKNELNSWQHYGSFNTVYTRTMGNDPNMLKGLFINDCVVEEVGEFEEFLEFFSASKDCFMSNQKQIGSCFIFGTGGKIDKGSKGFKEAWERDANKDWCKANNVERFLIDARRFYYFGGASLVQQRLPAESKLFKLYKPYQLIGVEDIELAEADIMRRRKEFLDSGNLKAYNEFVQNNPINEYEIFRKTSVNNFDTAILNFQREEILRLDHVPYTCFKPEYERDEKTGMVKQPLKVKMIPLKDHEDQSVSVKILDVDGHPARNFSNRYCAGIDSYNIDESKSSKSLGGMLVYDRQTFTPVAIIRCRPKTKEMFFDLCLKTSLYYGMYNNVLGDIASDTIMKTFSDAGAYGMLADRPKKFESLTSQQLHTKWVRLAPLAKEMMVGLMQFHVNSHVKNIKFVELIDEILSYDEESKDSDNDLADAYGMALMQHISYEVAPRNEDENQVHDRFDIPEFVSDGQGGIRLKGNSGPIRNIQQDDNLMRQMFGGHIT